MSTNESLPRLASPPDGHDHDLQAQTSQGPLPRHQKGRAKRGTVRPRKTVFLSNPMASIKCVGVCFSVIVRDVVVCRDSSIKKRV